VVNKPVVIYDARLELPPPARIDGDLYVRLQENADARKRARRREIAKWVVGFVVAVVVGSAIGWAVAW
jgi:hypothetical protein